MSDGAPGVTEPDRAGHETLGRTLRDEVGKALVGQEAMVDGLLMGLLTGGHVLLEGLPGLAKTLAVRSLSQAIDTGFLAHGRVHRLMGKLESYVCADCGYHESYVVEPHAIEWEAMRGFRWVNEPLPDEPGDELARESLAPR